MMKRCWWLERLSKDCSSTSDCICSGLFVGNKAILSTLQSSEVAAVLLRRSQLMHPMRLHYHTGVSSCHFDSRACIIQARCRENVLLATIAEARNGI